MLMLVIQTFKMPFCSCSECLATTKYVHIKSTTVYAPRLNCWDSPQPPTRRLVCPLPPVSGGRGTLAGEKGVGRVPIPTRGIHCGTLYMYVLCARYHRLNMELDLQSLFGLLCTAALIGWDLATPPPPPSRIRAHIYEGAIGQPSEYWIN